MTNSCTFLLVFLECVNSFSDSVCSIKAAKVYRVDMLVSSGNRAMISLYIIEKGR